MNWSQELRHICILKLVKFFAHTLDWWHFGFTCNWLIFSPGESATCTKHFCFTFIVANLGIFMYCLYFLPALQPFRFCRYILHSTCSLVFLHLCIFASFTDKSLYVLYFYRCFMFVLCSSSNSDNTSLHHHVSYVNLTVSITHFVVNTQTYI